MIFQIMASRSWTCGLSNTMIPTTGHRQLSERSRTTIVSVFRGKRRSGRCCCQRQNAAKARSCQSCNCTVAFSKGSKAPKSTSNRPTRTRRQPWSRPGPTAKIGKEDLLQVKLTQLSVLDLKIRSRRKGSVRRKRSRGGYSRRIPRKPPRLRSSKQSSRTPGRSPRSQRKLSLRPIRRSNLQNSFMTLMTMSRWLM